GPSIGMDDFSFKGSALILTVKLGIASAAVKFGAGHDPTATDTVQATLTDLVGLFDVSVDVFALLQGEVNVDFTGKFAITAGRLDVDIPDVLRLTGTNIA